MTGDKKKQIIVFIAAPGAGKGALSTAAVKELGWIQLSTGDLCRRHIADKTAIGRCISESIARGELVSDQTITDMVKDWFIHNSRDENSCVILDGYPRTLEQVGHLQQMLARELQGYGITVVRLELPKSEIVARMSGRVVCSNKSCQAVYSTLPGSALAPKKDKQCDACAEELVKRSDDQPESIEKRLAVYQEHEESLLEAYRTASTPILVLDVSGQPVDVYAGFKKLLGF